MNALRHILWTTTLAAICGAAACGPPAGTEPPKPGVLTLDVRSSPPALPQLVVADGGLHLEHFTVFGDVAPDPRGMVAGDTVVPWLSGLALTFSELPPGLYSRVRFEVEHIILDGTFEGAPLHIRLDEVELRVDLRSASGVELSPGHDAHLTVAVDASQWLEGIALGTAVRDNGEIQIDKNHNVDLLRAIAARVGSASFSLGDPVE